MRSVLNSDSQRRRHPPHQPTSSERTSRAPPMPPRNEKSLVCFIQALVGTTVVIECRDDVAVRGQLEFCDDDMHCTLTSAIRVTPGGEKTKLDRIFIRARMIRYVHFAPSIDPSALIETKRQEWFEGSRHYAKAAAFGPKKRSKSNFRLMRSNRIYI